MKIATLIIRILLGVLFVFASVSYFFNLFPQPELMGNMKIFNDGLNASGYLIPLIKTIEVLCGIAFITGRFVPLAVVVVFPVAVNTLVCTYSLHPRDYQLHFS